MSNESLYNTNNEQITTEELGDENNSQTITLNYGPIKCLSSYKSQIHLKRDKCHLCTLFKWKTKTKFFKEIYNEHFAQR